jgi:REP-associated tyrosine transposase
MQFVDRGIYHIYNRGNNKLPIFFNGNNCLHFLKKVRKEIVPHCDILAYCLMPNHFHFLVQVRSLLAQAFKQIDIKESISQNGRISVQSERHPLSSAIGILLSSYSQAVNKQNGTTGSLFQQKTKAKFLDNVDLARTVFHYIHQNPVEAGLVKHMEDWHFSSFRDYAGLRKGNLCNQELAFELFGFDKRSFYEESYRAIQEKEMRDIF